MSIRLERLGAPMEGSAHRSGDHAPVDRDALLNNFDGDSVEHFSVPCVYGLASLDGSGASWDLEGPRHNGDTASRLADVRRCHRRDIPLAATPRAAPPFRVALDAAAGFRGRWPRLGAGVLDAVHPFGSGGMRQLVSRVRTWSSAMS